MIDYYALEALAIVAKEGSFTKAADALFITQSAISQRIKGLENLVGRPLIVRSPNIRATLAGEQMISHFHNINMLEFDLRKKCAFRHDVQEHFPLTIAVNTESLSTWFIGAIGSTLRNGEIILKILIDDQERTIDYLKRGLVWACVTSIPEVPYGCTSEILGEMTYRLVATPEFTKKHFSDGVNGKALLRAPAAIYGDNDYMHRDFLSSLFKSYKNGKPTLHLVPSPQTLVAFALNGFAFVLLPEMSILDNLKKGDLVDLMPHRPFRLRLFFQTQELQTDTTAAFSKSIVLSARSLIF